ncbi:MAG TPA: alpha-L-rhamnosidase [Sphaerochaeta sp.]|jgi:alpha-L-rhamnosidase|nr:alpha-L-rhamnosidase [Sphaerochaeta sp.]
MNESLLVDYLDVDGRCNPLGLDTKHPVFHYTVTSSGYDKHITYLHIVVSRIDDIVWDSGKIPASEHPYITYAGPNLQSKTRYTVKLRVWDEQHLPCPFSKESWFETGLLEDGFQADWIEPVQENAVPEPEIPYFWVFKPRADHRGNTDRCRPAQNMRRAFSLSGRVAKARLYASAHGVYEAWVNGEKAGNTYLDPGISTYQKRLYYQTFEITESLQEGENILSFTVADGWWIGRIGLIGSSCQYGNRLGLIYQLEVVYEDGRTQTICSDSETVCSESEIRYADLYIGQKTDLRMLQKGWKQPGFDASTWKPCLVGTESKGSLIAQPIDGVIAYQYLLSEAWLTTPSGECVVDFGQVIAGTIEILLEAEDNDYLKLEYSEVLDESGNYLCNIMGRNKDQVDELACTKGRHTFKPTFTYHGFRYVKISGIDRHKILSISAIVLTSELRKTGEFECSDEQINQLQQNIVWSQRANMFSIPTDCPQREKMGWTGDIQIFAKTGCFNYDLKTFLSVWLGNLREEQTEDGGVPTIIPNFPKQDWMQRQIGGGYNTSSGWSDACILLPWYLYQCYADISILAENFICMQRYLGFIKEQAAQIPEGYDQFTDEQKQRNQYLWNKGYHFGDWLIPSLLKSDDGINLGRQQTRDVVGSCWYAITLDAYLQICTMLVQELGWPLQKEIAEKTRLLESVRKAIRDEFVTAEGRVSDSNLQGLYIMVLQSKCTDAALRRRVAEQLVSLLEKNGWRLDAGFSSISFLMDVLVEHGYSEAAHRLLFQKKSPSWLYMVEKNATTIWEKWEAVTEEGKVENASYNHYAFGCIGDWIYRTIGGIRAGSPGYKHIIIYPDLDAGISKAYCSLVSPFGTIICDWQFENNIYTITVQIPVNTTAELRVRDVVLRLGSGKHDFSFKIPCKGVLLD